jgi:hypothetical protein
MNGFQTAGRRIKFVTLIVTGRRCLAIPFQKYLSGQAEEMDIYAL